MPLRANATETEARLANLAEAIFARDKELPVIVAGSDEWKAWRGWRVDHGLSVVLMDKQGRWTVPLQWPPADLEGALANVGGGLGSKLKQ